MKNWSHTAAVGYGDSGSAVAGAAADSVVHTRRMTARDREGLEAIRSASANKPHGTRARYVGGRCRCLLCRAANSNYSCARERARSLGDTRDIVPADATRAHILKLSEAGIGRDVVADVAGVAVSIIDEVRTGKRLRVRRSTERNILAVDESARSGGARIPAGPTWRLLNDLLARGYTKLQLATWLGMKAGTPSLQVHKKIVTVRTAVKVERLYLGIEAGRYQRAS